MAVTRTRVPAKPTPEARQRAALRRRVDAADEQRSQGAEAAKAERAAERARKRDNVRDAAAYAAGQWRLGPVDTRTLVNATLAAFDRGEFGPTTIRDKLAEMGRGVRVPRGASPLDAQLPPPAQQGRRPPPGARSREQDAQEEERRRALERGERHRAQNERDREAYRDALARHGLQDPGVGHTPGNGGSLGL
jgi:hypothetical protein